MKKTINLKEFITNSVIFLVTLISCLAIIGEGADIYKFYSFDDNSVNMTMSSSILGLMSALICVFDRTNETLKLIFTVSIVTICFFVTTSWIFNNSRPSFFPLFENTTLIYRSDDLPSFGTILGYFVFSINNYIAKKRLSIILLILGSVAFLGHAIKEPLMYWKFTDYPNGISINMALILILLSIYQRLNKNGNKNISL